MLLPTSTQPSPPIPQAITTQLSENITLLSKCRQKQVSPAIYQVSNTPSCGEPPLQLYCYPCSGLSL